MYMLLVWGRRLRGKVIHYGVSIHLGDSSCWFFLSLLYGVIFFNEGGRVALEALLLLLKFPGRVTTDDRFLIGDELLCH